MAPFLERTARAARHAGPSLVAALLLATLATGCAAVTNPVADGVPVRRLPPELLEGRAKNDEVSIPLDLLGQCPPDVYRLAPGDVLGVYIEGVLGERTLAPPASLPPPYLIREQRRLPPSFGYPVPVREDGTVRLPLLEPVPVKGLSVAHAEDTIRDLYAKKQILPAGKERILVSLMSPRQTSVVILRQESGNISLSPQGGLGGGKRGTGTVIDLPAYENDVLHALTLSGGLPGLDAYDEVFVFRGCFRDPQDRAVVLEKLKCLPPGHSALTAAGLGQPVVRIPLRLPPGQPLPLRPEDVVLQTGDVLLVEARDQDLFYTGGLLPGGEHILPRDYDLDVVEAVARVQGSLINGAFSTSNLSGLLIAPGLGNPSPTLLTVLRKTPGGGQVPIRVDLARALQDRRERILVRPGDLLILQEKPSEAVARYFTQTFFNFNVVWNAFHTSNAAGVINAAAPDRLSTSTVTTNNIFNP